MNSLIDEERIPAPGPPRAGRDARRRLERRTARLLVRELVDGGVPLDGVSLEEMKQRLVRAVRKARDSRVDAQDA